MHCYKHHRNNCCCNNANVTILINKKCTIERVVTKRSIEQICYKCNSYNASCYKSNPYNASCNNWVCKASNHRGYSVMVPCNTVSNRCMFYTCFHHSIRHIGISVEHDFVNDVVLPNIKHFKSMTHTNSCFYKRLYCNINYSTGVVGCSFKIPFLKSRAKGPRARGVPPFQLK